MRMKIGSGLAAALSMGVSASLLLAGMASAAAAAALRSGPARAAVAVPHPGRTSQLAAVTCGPPGRCWAVGSYTQHRASHNEMFGWDGHGWVRASVPEPRGQCRAPGDCWAVGDDEGGPEALHWNGGLWALVRTPDPGGAGFCTASAACGPPAASPSDSAMFRRSRIWPCTGTASAG
jgi:hypothetical protein